MDRRDLVDIRELSWFASCAEGSRDPRLLERLKEDVLVAEFSSLEDVDVLGSSVSGALSGCREEFALADVAVVMAVLFEARVLEARGWSSIRRGRDTVVCQSRAYWCAEKKLQR